MVVYAFLLQGYRSMMGIGVVQSCESALSYYYKAAKKGSQYICACVLHDIYEVK